METSIVPTNSQELKSYWSRPGEIRNRSGIAILGLIGYYVLPILTGIVWNTVNFVIAVAVLSILLYCLMHRKLRLSFFYLYEILMKKLVGIVIELDPFIIAEDYIHDMEEQREKLYKQSIDVDAQKEKLQLKIREKEKEIEKLMHRAQAAKDNNMMPELGNASRQIGRLKEYIAQLTPIRDNLTRMGDTLTAIHKNSAYLIEDAKNELEVKKDLYKSITMGNKAMSSALKIFKGDPEKKLLVEQSMEYLKEDIASKLANMKKALNYSADFMRSIDLDNATYEKEGLKLIETFSPDTEFRLKSSNTSNPTSNPSTISNYNDLLS